MFKTRLSVLFLATALLAVSMPSQAYLDPGTGSIILQGFIAAIATIGFAAKMYWHRVVAFFKGERGDSGKSPGSEQDAEHGIDAGQEADQNGKSPD